MKSERAADHCRRAGFCPLCRWGYRAPLNASRRPRRWDRACRALHSLGCRRRRSAWPLSDAAVDDAPAKASATPSDPRARHSGAPREPRPTAGKGIPITRRPTTSRSTPMNLGQPRTSGDPSARLMEHLDEATLRRLTTGSATFSEVPRRPKRAERLAWSGGPAWPVGTSLTGDPRGDRP